MKGVGVELQDDALVAPERVDLEAFRVRVELRPRKSRRAHERDDAPLGPRAREGGLLEQRPQRANAGARAGALDRLLDIALRDEALDLRLLDSVAKLAPGEPRRDLQQRAGGRAHRYASHEASFARRERALVGSDAAHPDAAARDGDVERAPWMRSESVQRRGGIVRERRIRAAREHGGVGPSEQRNVGCAPEIDAAMDRVQDAAAHPVCDGATPDAERRELKRRDDAVLSRRHP
ncbi:MAG TPA: hypothetical protein VGV90_08745, partial [Solirubrobacteraceae bacterium]|nr:hypothetical protein [Solirubrobacteraceae bacterium]